MPIGLVLIHSVEERLRFFYPIFNPPPYISEKFPKSLIIRVLVVPIYQHGEHVGCKNDDGMVGGVDENG